MSNRGNLGLNRRLSRLLICAIVICLTVFGAVEANANWFNDDAPIKEENGKQVYVTHIAGVEYHIPVGYFRYTFTTPSEHEKEILLNTMWPELRPINPNSSEVTTPGWGQQVHILVSDALSTTSFEFRLGSCVTSKSRSTRLYATVSEMKEGPSGSAVRC